MIDKMKIVKALEDSNILLKGISKIIKNETKEQKGGFLSMLLGTLGANLLGNLLTGKGIVKDGSENKKWKGIIKVGTGLLCPLLRKNNGIFNTASSVIKFWNKKNIMKTNQDLMVYFQETVYLKNKGWGECNKPWWICRSRYTLDCFIL